MINICVSLAKEAVEIYVNEGKIILPLENLPKEFLTKKSGTFVTIEKKGRLRGCIGTYLPTRENIAQEIIHNVIAAATEDYRFGPIRKQELPDLSYTVYILSKPELVLELNPVKWASPKIRKILFDRVNPKKYGIIIKTVPISYPRPVGSVSPRRKRAEQGSPGAVNVNETDVVFDGHAVPKSGLLLPDLEGIDIAEKQVFIACQKGGIDPGKEKIIIYKFLAEKYQ